MSLKINNALRLVRVLRNIDPDMSLMVAETFMIICQNEGVGVGELADKVGITLAGSSRHVSHLSSYGRNGKPGLQLVDLRERLEDRRFKGCFLTTKGKRLMSEVEQSF
jgi:DNA-binding MarR family transcriptional regulator